MNKAQLLDLAERVKLVAGVEMPIIVGSQSLYAVTTFVPDSVKQSIECDFLLLAVGPPAYRAVIEQIGFASSFQEMHGYYADAVGLFIKDVLDRGMAEMETFLERAELVLDMPQSAALLPRMEKLENYLRGARTSQELRPLEQLIKRLRSSTGS